MSGDAARDKGTLDSALLFLSREPSCLALLLERFLSPALLQELAQSGGHRKPGNHAPALQVAEVLGQHPRLRKAAVAALLTSLPKDPVAVVPSGGLAKDLEPAELLSSLAFDLLQADADARQRVMDHIVAWAEFIPVAEDADTGREELHSRGKDAEAEPTKATAEDRMAALKGQLLDTRRELSRMEEDLGRERKRRTELKEQVAEAQAERRDAEARAAEWKKRLAASTEASERERELAEEAVLARQKQHVAEQKVDILAWERDDLRACLEDRDRFDAVREEEVPSFRNRPLLDREQMLAARLAERDNTFRILVVGGGEPQFRHRDKLLEYAEVMGFHSDWRMAEYVSWHKEMDKLSTDMNTRFDALVILHWNRTTFTRKAREVCNQAGQKPCITCYYEGFTSLRETLQECLRQLLARDREP
ncbi:MAG: hypothetical protein ACYSU1_02710 [Planctomycetota bacterium]|jgi:hypothetical protein